jgi:hypothetical protein
MNTVISIPAAPTLIPDTKLSAETVECQLQSQTQVIADVPVKRDREHDSMSDTAKLEQLIRKKKYWGFLEGKDATLYFEMMNVRASAETPIDIPSYISKLFRLLPGDRQLERRSRKLAWHLSQGRRPICDHDEIILSELTPAERRMSDDDFLATYPDQVKTTTRKGGRPRKYRTVTARRKGHAERQRRYRERKSVVVRDVTKTPSQAAER